MQAPSGNSLLQSSAGTKTKPKSASSTKKKRNATDLSYQEKLKVSELAIHYVNISSFIRILLTNFMLKRMFIITFVQLTVLVFSLLDGIVHVLRYSYGCNVVRLIEI